MPWRRPWSASYGALTVLVNNAGVGMTGSFSDMTAEDWTFIRSDQPRWRRQLLLCLHPSHAGGGPGPGGQRLIRAGLHGRRPSESAYGATKAAVLQLSLCLRADWSGRGVGVTAVCPGFINTADRPLGPLHRRARRTPARRARLVKGFARAHPPEKVGDAIVKAIATNRALVPVGFESVLGWYAHRLTPIAFQQSRPPERAHPDAIAPPPPQPSQPPGTRHAAATLGGGRGGLPEGDGVADPPPGAGRHSRLGDHAPPARTAESSGGAR